MNLHQEILVILDSLEKNKWHNLSSIKDAVNKIDSDLDIMHNMHACLEDLKKKGKVEHIKKSKNNKEPMYKFKEF